MFHSHRLSETGKYVQPDAANFNSWRRHVRLLGDPPDEVVHSWEDVKAMFNGGTRKRMMSSSPMGGGPESPPGQSPPSVSHHGYHSPPPPCKQVKTEVRGDILVKGYNTRLMDVKLIRCGNEKELFVTFTCSCLNCHHLVF